MGVEKILEKEFGFTIWSGEPFARLKVLCSCGKKYIVKEKFISRGGDYIRSAKCPNSECGDISSIIYRLSYPDEGPIYNAEVVTEKSHKNI
ncbi:MAG: hypothetical protein AABX99_02265 [Nanoarchaeota archaeon]